LSEGAVPTSREDLKRTLRDLEDFDNENRVKVKMSLDTLNEISDLLKTRRRKDEVDEKFMSRMFWHFDLRSEIQPAADEIMNTYKPICEQLVADIENILREGSLFLDPSIMEYLPFAKYILENVEPALQAPQDQLETEPRFETESEAYQIAKKRLVRVIEILNMLDVVLKTLLVVLEI
jgi:hypothetical protein